MMVPVWEILERAQANYKLLPEDMEEVKVKEEAAEAANAHAASFRRVAVVGLLVLTAMFVPGFSIFISLVGSVCCGSLAFILPAIVHVMAQPEIKVKNEEKEIPMQEHAETENL